VCGGLPFPAGVARTAARPQSRRRPLRPAIDTGLERPKRSAHPLPAGGLLEGSRLQISSAYRFRCKSMQRTTRQRRQPISLCGEHVPRLDGDDIRRAVMRWIDTDQGFTSMDSLDMLRQFHANPGEVGSATERRWYWSQPD